MHVHPYTRLINKEVANCSQSGVQGGCSSLLVQKGLVTRLLAPSGDRETSSKEEIFLKSPVV
jgi:hypothetical protein